MSRNENKFVQLEHTWQIIIYLFIYFLTIFCVPQEFFDTVVVFLRLEKIQFGGVHGQPLSDMVEAMFTEFNELLAAFTSKPEDPLNIANNVSKLNLFIDIKIKIHKTVIVCA